MQNGTIPVSKKYVSALHYGCDMSGWLVAQVWVCPEQHGTITAVFKNQVSPAQGAELMIICHNVVLENQVCPPPRQKGLLVAPRLSQSLNWKRVVYSIAHRLSQSLAGLT